MSEAEELSLFLMILIPSTAERSRTIFRPARRFVGQKHSAVTKRSRLNELQSSGHSAIAKQPLTATQQYGVDPQVVLVDQAFLHQALHQVAASGSVDLVVSLLEPRRLIGNITLEQSRVVPSNPVDRSRSDILGRLVQPYRNRVVGGRVRPITGE